MRPNLRSLASPFVVTLLVVACAPACNRAPQEPAPVASTRAQEVVIAPAASAPAPSEAAGRPLAPSTRDRCIAPTSDTPPPPVKPGPAPGCPRDPEGAGTLATATLGAPEASSGATKLVVELALTEDQRERGLMYRTSMPEDHGMLFQMEAHAVHRFWMRNTCIPLDMLFVDPDGLIVGILENVPTLNTDERAVGCPSSYVLETNAGWSRRHGVRAGQRLVLPKL